MIPDLIASNIEPTSVHQPKAFPTSKTAATNTPIATPTAITIGNIGAIAAHVAVAAAHHAGIYVVHNTPAINAIAPATIPTPIPSLAKSGKPLKASCIPFTTPFILSIAPVTPLTIPTSTGVNGTSILSKRLLMVMLNTCHASSKLSTLFANSS